MVTTDSNTPPAHSDTTPPPAAAAAAATKRYEAEDDTKKFPRISRDVELMRSSYDCVVIGSGYGGAVAASRMARSVGGRDGKRPSVCVLERGKERWPGEYPSSPVDALKDLHVSGELAPGRTAGRMVDGGDPTGMYHLIFGKGLSAVVGNGKWMIMMMMMMMKTRAPGLLYPRPRRHKPHQRQCVSGDRQGDA